MNPAFFEFFNGFLTRGEVFLLAIILLIAIHQSRQIRQLNHKIALLSQAIIDLQTELKAEIQVLRTEIYQLRADFRDGYPTRISHH